ncbi:thioredoxin [Velocimicrobium porci]|uniref:Thioredoxin n=1 Tax=Velocimicrobium porci TaxID=2606634 RepID=A0A6L5XWW2_9FIRM|nr:thioredoxin [Velocimicrobium porci]MSS62931.1 thioredoxin [Velocimicrobium porci]
MELRVTGDNFQSEVLESNKLAVVDFYADWCGPCQMMAPIVEKLANEYEGEVVIGKLNVDEESGISRQYRVMSIPTIIFFKNGEAADKIIGAVSEDELREKIEKLK